jgi:hypothetical protein
VVDVSVVAHDESPIVNTRAKPQIVVPMRFIAIK